MRQLLRRRPAATAAELVTDVRSVAILSSKELASVGRSDRKDGGRLRYYCHRCRPRGAELARRLTAQGLDVRVLEAADGVGGRVRTDDVNGFQLDRGFQVLLTAYPEAQEVLDYAALDLRPFYAGALIRAAGGFHRLADPWRHPWDALRGLFAPVGGLRDKLRVGRLRRWVLSRELHQLFSGSEESSIAFLRTFGFSDAMIERFFRPFFAGVFLKSELQTSSRMLQFVFAMFAAGDAALPAAGMEAMPRQLAARLPADRIRLKAEAIRIGNGGGAGAIGIREATGWLAPFSPGPATRRCDLPAADGS